VVTPAPPQVAIVPVVAMTRVKSFNERLTFLFLRILPTPVSKHTKVFLSYAWPSNVTETESIHSWLVQSLLAISNSLALNSSSGRWNMTHDMRAKMINGIASADVFIPVCTPIMKLKCNDSKSNVLLELSEAVKQGKKIVPLLYQGDISNSVPDIIMPYCSALVDMTNAANYHKIVAETLLEKVFDISP